MFIFRMMGGILSLDFKILNYLQQFHSGPLDLIMKFFTYIGENGYIWIALGLLFLCFKKTRKMGIYLLITLAIEFICNDLVLKHIIKRQRPFFYNKRINMVIKRPTSYSFPSGHASAAFSSATAIFMHDKIKGLFAYLVAIAISVSRIYFYVHYPSDIVCGAILGMIVAIIVRLMGKAIEKRHMRLYHPELYAEMMEKARKEEQGINDDEVEFLEL